MNYTNKMEELLEGLRLGCKNLSFIRPPSNCTIKDLRSSQLVLDKMRKTIEADYGLNQYMWNGFYTDLVETTEGMDNLIIKSQINLTYRYI